MTRVVIQTGDAIFFTFTRSIDVFLGSNALSDSGRLALILCLSTWCLGRGYGIGQRLIDELLAKSNVGACSDLKETAEVVAKVGFKMFLGVSATVSCNLTLAVTAERNHKDKAQSS
eukprot:991107-Rhodomonas_salina.3